jgi:hypothetical protein
VNKAATPSVARALAKTEAFERSRRDRKRVEMLFAHLKRIFRLGRLRLRVEFGGSGVSDHPLLGSRRPIKNVVPPATRLSSPTSATKSARSGHCAARHPHWPTLIATSRFLAADAEVTPRTSAAPINVRRFIHTLLMS